MAISELCVSENVIYEFKFTDPYQSQVIFGFVSALSVVPQISNVRIIFDITKFLLLKIVNFFLYIHPR